MDPVLIGKLTDDLYEYEGYDHVRFTARGLIENEEGKFGFLHIVGEDLFGERDHLETCGGGIEEKEHREWCRTLHRFPSAPAVVLRIPSTAPSGASD